MTLYCKGLVTSATGSEVKVRTLTTFLYRVIIFFFGGELAYFFGICQRQMLWYMPAFPREMYIKDKE